MKFLFDLLPVALFFAAFKLADIYVATGVAIAVESGVEAGQAVDAALIAGDVSRRRFSRYERRQQQRFRSFRRFVRAFYTREFRELFFDEAPPPRMFAALVTVFAGYWNPPLAVRLWVTAFFILVRLQKWVPIVPRSHPVSVAPGMTRRV